MGTGSNGQGSGGGNGGKGGNPQGNKPSRSGAQNTTTRKVSFCMDYNEEPAPAKTLRFIEKGFDLTPSPIAVPQPYDGNKRSRHHDARARRQAHKKSPGKGQGKMKPLAFRAVREMVGAVAVTGMPKSRGTPSAGSSLLNRLQLRSNCDSVQPS